MTKAELSKLSGWAFILGSFSLATILSGSDPLAIPGSVISSILLAVGMSGLRARYGEKVGRLGRNILLLGVMAPVLLIIAIASMAVVTIAQIEEGYWILVFVGPAISLLGLTLFGLAALRSKPMPRLNWLPFFAGIWYPVAYLFLAGYLFTNNGVFPQQYYTAIQIMFLIQFLALCVFGASLISDTTQEMATA
jgi:hypothetical protein